MLTTAKAAVVAAAGKVVAVVMAAVVAVVTPVVARAAVAVVVVVDRQTRVLSRSQQAHDISAPLAQAKIRGFAKLGEIIRQIQ